jgi:hypothetical protein
LFKEVNQLQRGHFRNDDYQEKKMRNFRLVAVATAAVLSLAAAYNQGAANPVSYNFLQVDGDKTRIGINGPAAMAQIPLSNQKIIVLHGAPIASFKDSTGTEQGDLGLTDTIVEVTGAIPERPDSEAQLQFRLVALSLTGSFLDDTGQKWQVRVSLSQKRDQPISTATVRNNGGSTGQGGGTFDSVLHLLPRFVFTRAGATGGERIVDNPDQMGVRFVAANAEWSAVPPSGAVRPDLNGGFFAVQAVHGGEAGQHATKAAVMTTAR